MQTRSNSTSKRSIDLDTLDELIRKCEDSMVSPFRKAKKDPASDADKGMAIIRVEPGEQGEDEELGDSEHEQDQHAAPVEEEAVHYDSEPTKPDLSDLDLEDLLKMYQELKGSK